VAYDRCKLHTDWYKEEIIIANYLGSRFSNNNAQKKNKAIKLQTSHFELHVGPISTLSTPTPLQVLLLIMMMMMIMPMGRTYFSELRPQWSYCSSPRSYMSMENHDGIVSTRKNTWFFHDCSLAILPAESSSSKSRGTWRRKWFSLSKYLSSYSARIFNLP
jgi:hypothetical protein